VELGRGQGLEYCIAARVGFVFRLDYGQVVVCKTLKNFSLIN
jgi:hypothetical protein